MVARWLRKRRTERRKRLESERRREAMAARTEDEVELATLEALILCSHDAERLHSRVDNILLKLIQDTHPKTHARIESLKPGLGYLTAEMAKERYK